MPYVNVHDLSTLFLTKEPTKQYSLSSLILELYELLWNCELINFLFFIAA